MVVKRATARPKSKVENPSIWSLKGPLRLENVGAIYTSSYPISSMQAPYSVDLNRLDPLVDIIYMGRFLPSSHF